MASAKFVTVNEHCLHPIGEALSSCVKDGQIRLSLARFLRQHQSGLNVRLKAKITP
jgi:hypothetical protein